MKHKARWWGTLGKGTLLFLVILLPIPPLLFVVFATGESGEQTPGSAAIANPDRLEARLSELEDRFTPGLHSLMVEVGMRHATLWFAGDALNWPLADYQIHELEEILEEIEVLHPVYDDVPVGELVRAMSTPAVEAVEDAIEANDHEAFIQAYDGLTASCNGCHHAADRSVIVIQRPATPPSTNLRFSP